jgi:uncharacterized protein YdbL (DUF1318 family)
MLRQVRILAAAAAAAALAGAPALAGPALDGAKSSCQIGETISGFLAVVPGETPSPDARAEMDETNNGRRAVYQRVARENGQPLEVVAQLTGERQVERAKTAGECFQDAGGWKKSR